VRGLDVRPGVDAELIGQPRPQRLVHCQRVCLPPGGGQRAHQQGGELLVQRVPGNELLELGDVRGGLADVNRPADLRDQGIEAQPVQAMRVRRGEVADIGERRSAPERQRLAHRGRPLREEPLKAQRVHILGRDR